METLLVESVKSSTSNILDARKLNFIPSTSSANLVNSVVRPCKNKLNITNDAMHKEGLNSTFLDL